MNPPYPMALLLICFLLPAYAIPAPVFESLNVLAFYDSRLTPEPSDNPLHKTAEMPLNHLGVLVRYHDLAQPLPSARDLEGVRGILIWMDADYLSDPEGLLNWLIERMNAGLRVIVMGPHAFARHEDGTPADPALLKRFWRLMGIEMKQTWVDMPLDFTLQKLDPWMTGFERNLSGLPPGFPVAHAREGKVHLRAKAKRDETASDLVVTGKRGGYVAPGYAVTLANQGRERYWHIDPFRFFESALDLASTPRADITTIVGRRLFYSHIDGDGWRNLSLVPGYRNRGALVTDVVFNEILKHYPDLPVSVGPIAADLDPYWFGSSQTQNIARAIFALPHVEAASHTYSHPMEWAFFERYWPEKEAPFIGHYPVPAHRVSAKRRTIPDRKGWPTTKVEEHEGRTKSVYLVPRAYYNGPFTLQQDIAGSARYIEQFLPRGKHVKLIQWSGNEKPFEAAVHAARKAGLRNINGGDNRLDREYDSLLWLAPVGRKIGGERHIYASTSNENTYTHLWTGRYFGFRYLIQTLERTGRPRRLKPVNVHYHMYIGERTDSLNSLREVLDAVQDMDIAPITTSHFSAIADGFYQTRFQKLRPQAWRVVSRGRLSTVRFDHASMRTVDWRNSQGVLGQRHSQGSLYIHLDPAVETPEIALRVLKGISAHPTPAHRPYLISSQWPVNTLAFDEEKFRFSVQGYGSGDMQWYVPHLGRYQVELRYPMGNTKQQTLETNEAGQLRIHIKQAPLQPLFIEVRRLKNDDSPT